MSRASGRTATCDADDAKMRLKQAQAFVTVAELAVDDEDAYNGGVAASVAVLAGIAASDAACCARLGRRPRGQDHAGAIDLLKTVQPDGVALANDLGRLLAIKDNVHYGTLVISSRDAKAAVNRARRMTETVARMLA